MSHNALTVDDLPPAVDFDDDNIMHHWIHRINAWYIDEKPHISPFKQHMVELMLMDVTRSCYTGDGTSRKIILASVITMIRDWPIDARKELVLSQRIKFKF